MSIVLYTLSYIAVFIGGAFAHRWLTKQAVKISDVTHL